MPGKASSDGTPPKAIFEIKTAEHFLKIFMENCEDFKNDPESTRHAINAIITGYHLHEWVWGDKIKTNFLLMKKLRLKNKKIGGFIDWIIGECPEFEMARTIPNGSKHFDLSESGKQEGAFSRDFSTEFDVSYLYVCDEKGTRVTADELIKNLVKFWERVFKEF